ncbi:SDR family oxidoreductase [Reyranella sp. MMS21-HV4-11]|uniref:SDR family oxidoreductase n=1 Tax=Reyranella humidisoli TaxID=2849149 RepID=A0ABS6ILI2_9HYPH|nr:SDR family NAD(P)-dependent oxidoreductase [Reyranella sp. MMS21-HV4-11]MBU8874083.1 SDR family oxidoreductase [Reyranella sp. MMS21-HV4-11]
MGKRVAGKIAVVVGAGQTPGETIGNGAAISLLLAREGATVLCVDRVGERADKTVAVIAADELAREGGAAPVLSSMAADITKAADCARIVAEARARYGRIDILINNVGIGGGGDAPAHRLEEKVLDRILAVNLKGMWLTTKAALPLMREQECGAIVNISSLAATSGATQLAYEISKAAVNRLTTHVAQSNARYGIRANAIMMGFMDTPMAVTGIAEASGRTTDAVRAERNAMVPLRRRMGTGFDTAYAALYLASDEAQFVTGEILRVDGGMGLGTV